MNMDGDLKFEPCVPKKNRNEIQTSERANSDRTNGLPSRVKARKESFSVVSPHRSTSTHILRVTRPFVEPVMLCVTMEHRYGARTYDVHTGRERSSQ